MLSKMCKNIYVQHFTSYYVNDNIQHNSFHKKCIPKIYKKITKWGWGWECTCVALVRQVDGIHNKGFVKVQSYVFLLSHFGRLIVARIH